MKAKLIIILGSLLISSYSYGCGGGGCQQGSNPCGDSIDTCQCTDPNYDSNHCMTIGDYCDAFGNIAGLNDYP